MNTVGGDGETRVSRSEQPLSIEEVVHHLRSGRTVAGEPVRPYKWLDFAGGERSPMELRVSRVMESCSFKASLSCVLGMRTLAVTQDPSESQTPLFNSTHSSNLGHN